MKKSYRGKFIFTICLIAYVIISFNLKKGNIEEPKKGNNEEIYRVPFSSIAENIKTKYHCNNSYFPCKVPQEVIELSLQLNTAQRILARLSCEMIENEGASQKGGWCRKISGKNSIEHITDENLAKELSKFLQNKQVASFGDGPGEYKRIITSLNEVKTYDAFDGAPYCEETTDNLVQHLDLSVPVYHLNLYDWIISLEVAEHIPKIYEQIFIDNLTRHAKEGIILSWAAIGQVGHSHVNNQDLSYVREQLEKRDFKINLELSKPFKNATKLVWLKKNMYIYTRINPIYN